MLLNSTQSKCFFLHVLATVHCLLISVISSFMLEPGYMAPNKMLILENADSLYLHMWPF